MTHNCPESILQWAARLRFTRSKALYLYLCSNTCFLRTGTEASLTGPSAFHEQSREMDPSIGILEHDGFRIVELFDFDMPLLITATVV